MTLRGRPFSDQYQLDTLPSTTGENFCIASAEKLAHSGYWWVCFSTHIRYG